MTTATRLSALDVSFLNLERDDAPMHVGSVALFDGDPLRDEHGRVRIDDIKHQFVARLPRLPRFRQRVEWPPLHGGLPWWVDDERFDITRHVRLVWLPPPGSDEQLRDLVAAVHMDLLDRRHPLWEVVLVDGVRDGLVAVIEKIHHSMIDGVSGVDVATMTMDVTPDAPLDEISPYVPDPHPSPLRLLLGDVLGTPRRVVDTARTIGRLRSPEVAPGLSTFVSSGLAHPTSLNVRTGRERRYTTVTRLLDDIRLARRELGGTVNDIVLTAVAAGLHALFMARREEVDEVRALVPVSLRSADERGTLGNRVTSLYVPLPVGRHDLRRRHRIVCRTMAGLKESHEADATAALLDLANGFPMPLLAAIGELVHHQPFVNIVVTNVPGPPVPLYMWGARMREVAPIVPLAHNLDVSVGIVSYDSRLTLGLLADKDSFADLAVFADGIGDALDRLVAMARRSHSKKAS